MLRGQVGAILWAQWRALRNYGLRKRGGSALITGFFLTLWYGMWAMIALGIMEMARDVREFEVTVRPVLSPGLLVAFLYWQFVPIIMVSAGLSLDLSRLLIYPIPHRYLFIVEALLRITTASEMVIITAGLFAGLVRNPLLPWWAPLILFLYTLFNVLLSAGLRDLFARLMARRGVREVLVFFIVLCTVLPQAVILTEPGQESIRVVKHGFGNWWPWSVTARIASGEASPLALLALAGWTVLACAFAWAQFERTLRFDAAEARPASSSTESGGLLQRLFRIPDRLFPDPLAALVGKEIRFLSRAPRFRLLFLMGFSFGLIVWLPLALRSGASSGMHRNYLTVVSAYALMLLGEALFWNHMGMDRTAAQTYFVTPVPMGTVLVAKNLAAVFFIALEFSIVTITCLLLRMPITAQQVAEATGVTAVLTFLMLSMGNLLSTRYPRAVDPGKSWRSSAGRAQAYLLLLYPVLSIPVLLAYGARFAFDSDLAFWGVLIIDFILAGILYTVALESAVSVAISQRERIIEALSTSQSPVAG